MSKLRSPWLDADARSLVRRAATIERAPAGAKTRVLARVEAVIGLPDGAGDASARDTTRPPRAPLLPGGARALAIAAAFALGGGLGALLMARARHAPVPVEATPAPSMERLVPTATAAMPTETATPLWPPATARAVPSVPTASIANVRQVPAMAAPLARASSSEPPAPIAGERTLLDEARVAVEREDGIAALAATDEHARKYPHGVFVQEREAIAVRALLLLGRTDDARVRVDRFRERFPDSLLLPALESSTGIQPTP
jgi:hypothetical protein